MIESIKYNIIVFLFVVGTGSFVFASIGILPILFKKHMATGLIREGLYISLFCFFGVALIMNFEWR